MSEPCDLTKRRQWAILAAYDGLVVYVTLIPDLDLEQVSQVFVETLLKGLLSADSRG